MKLKNCIFTLVVMLSGFSSTVFAENVAKIGDTEYATLADAITHAEANATITLIANVNIAESTTIDKNITLDLNGHNISETVTDQFGAIYVKKGATLTIMATTGGEITTDGGVVVGNYGTVIVDGGTINAGEASETDVSIYNFYYQADYYGTMTIKGGTVDRIWNCGVATLNGGTITNVDNSGAMEIAEDATVTNIILRDGADAPEVPNTGKLTGAANLRVTMEDGFKAVYDNGIWTATTEPTGTVAHIGETYYYKSLADALGAAKTGETVTLDSDIAASEIITIDKAITLDGGSNTLTSTAARAINVSGADGATIENLTIEASGERAINIIQNATNVTIDNVTATAANYTVNVASSAPEAVVAITNSTLNGLCTVNVAAAGAQVTVDNSTVNCNDNNTTAGESYAALCLNKDAVGGSIVATNTTVNVTDGSDSKKGRNGAENGIVTINGSTDDVAVMVAVITYEGSDYYYSFATLEAAIEFAKAGDVVTLIRNIEVSEIITINKAITLDGNDKKLTATGCEFPIVVSQSAEVNFVNCNLAYTREFAAVDTWYALYVPFAIELTNDFLTKYDVAEFSEMTTESMTITMVEESTLAANTPYFILVKDEASKTLEITVDGAEFNAASTDLGDVATLNGVYTETVASTIAGAYAMSSGAFKQAKESTQTLKPFRFYLMFNEPSQAAALRTISINVDGEEGTTAIDNFIFTNGETVVYDLQGRRVENPAKGIYIVNGKKVVIK